MKSEEGASCTHCQGMGMCCAHGQWTTGKYAALRWLLGLLILAITFAIGIKIGEFKGSYMNDGYFGEKMHRGMMRTNNGDMMYFTPGMGSIRTLPVGPGAQATPPPTQATPVKPSTTTPVK